MLLKSYIKNEANLGGKYESYVRKTSGVSAI